VKESDPTSKKEAEELCRFLGLDPEKFWGVINNFACDCFFAGERAERDRARVANTPKEGR
jgi:hypothetical protein